MEQWSARVLARAQAQAPPWVSSPHAAAGVRRTPHLWTRYRCQQNKTVQKNCPDIVYPGHTWICASYRRAVPTIINIKRLLENVNANISMLIVFAYAERWLGSVKRMRICITNSTVKWCSDIEMRHYGKSFNNAQGWSTNELAGKSIIDANGDY